MRIAAFYRFILLLVVAVLPALAHARVLAIGMAKSDNHVYAWHDDGKVTAGSTVDFEIYRKAAPYAMPSGQHPSDIVAAAIDPTDRVHVWYKNGTYSIGHSQNLTAIQGPQSFSLPAGKTSADIVGMAFNSTGNVYTWYRDRSVSIGKAFALASIQSPLSVALPPDQTPDDIVEIDISAADRVVTWFRDGRLVIGKSRDLDAYQGPTGYRSSRLITRYWGPTFILAPPVGRVGQAAQGSSANAQPDSPSESQTTTVVGNSPNLTLGRADVPFDASPGWNKRFSAGTGQAIDSMIAAGHNYLVASDTSTLRFLDRDGNLLPEKAGMPSSMSTTTFFGGFLNETNTDGSYNYANVNHFLGYDQPCDSTAFPATSGNRFCIVSYYDTRVYYDAASQRFFVISNSRHPVFRSSAANSCIQYTDASNNSITSNQNCGAERRLIAFAVSRTSDPRDGFNQYMITDNIYRDFPWMSINGDRVVIGGVGKESNDSVTPVANVVDTSDVRVGLQHPAYSQYYSTDLFGSIRAIPVRHFNDGAGKTLLLDGSGTTLKILAIPAGADAWTKSTPITTSVSINDTLSNMPAATYRNGFLYFAQRTTAETVGSNSRYSVRLLRIPLQIGGSSLTASNSAAAGYVEDFFGLHSLDDAPNDRISYEAPSLAVNSNGDMLFGYGRYPFVTTNTLFPEARYSLWRGDLTLERSTLLQAGNATCATRVGAAVDYSTVDVDPVDGKSFWMALPYCSSSNTYTTVIGRVTP